jgi:hypothetical protein
MKYLILLFILISSSASEVFAQDSVRIFMFSEEVGTVVDPVERDTYKLFRKAEGEFIHGFFYQVDSNYFCKYRLSDKGREYDTVVFFSYASYLSGAARVQHYEHERMGKDFNINNTIINFKDSVIEIPSGVKNNLKEEIVQRKANELQVTRNIEEVKKGEAASGTLPLSDIRIDAEKLLRDAIEWYIGAGLVFDVNGFQGLNESFNYYELTIPEEGYSIPLTKKDYKAGTLFSFSSTVVIKNTYSLEMRFNSKVGEYDETELDYKSFKISGAWHYQVNDFLFPYISLGYMRAGFSVKQNYYVPVSETGYPLESIKIDGVLNGMSVSLGMFIEANEIFKINLSAGYKFTSGKEMHRTSPHPVTIKADGFEFSVNLMIR